jgi:hypothetical protein
MKASLGIALLMLALAGSLQAQLCTPGPESNEAKTFAHLSVPLAFGDATAPALKTAFKIGLDLSYLPNIDTAIATATICRPGKGPEHTDFLFALPRPRITVPLPGGLALQASWVPPIRISGVKANLVGLSLDKALTLSNGIDAAVGAHTTLGNIHAPITCDEDALTDPTSECFQGTVSDDRYSPNIFGADVSVGFGTGAIRPYVGGGYNRLQPRFQVNFTNRFGSTDTTRVEVNLDRGVVFGGATWQMDQRFDLTGEVYAAPADAVTARVVFRAALGKSPQ